MKSVTKVAIAIALALTIFATGPTGCTGKVKSELEEAKKQLITMNNEKTELAAKLKDLTAKNEELTKLLEEKKAEAEELNTKAEELEEKLKPPESGSTEDTEDTE